MLCAFWAYYTQYLYWFCIAKISLFLSLHHAMCSLVKTLHMRQVQNVTCVKNLTAICNWGFLWKAQGTRGMGVSSRINEGTSIVKGLDNTGYLSIHEQGLALNFFFFCIRVPLVTESLESFSKDMSWMVLHSALHWHSSRKYLNQPQDWL